MTHKTTYLKDYQPPLYRVDTIDLVFDLHEDFTTVRSVMQISANGHDGETHPIVLQGGDLQLVSVAVEGVTLKEGEYQLTPETLTLPPSGREVEVETVVQIKPQENTTLMGLYKSSGNFCTQCESEGFRRITYFVDRPDNLAVFSTTIVADKTHYPILLSNGNKVDGGELSGGRHWAKWHDPFPKAGHLFALVAGDLDCLEDEFITGSGRKVILHLFVEPGKTSQAQHAMHSLKLAMRWDEAVYGREYDLDIFMIVAVSDFNMGAMENKGLNIFNSKYILASFETATDTDYENILRVVGHEYFHNWSGNRVGCRDWFQLSLKEGFTVFRDQSFSADLTSAGVKRIADVKVLRSMQFAEDAGPMSHPVRPASYMEITNFYTLTVYEKGAEIIRMLHTLLGPEKFREATDLYFARFDGQTTTTDHFVACMEEASGLNLSQFKRWYDQAGTPQLSITDDYDGQTQRYTLQIQQQTPPTPGQPDKLPLHIPLKMALLDEKTGKIVREELVSLTQSQERLTFEGLANRPIPSFLRGFSAPVKLDYAYTDSQLKTLLLYETDYFARWEAGQSLALRQLQKIVAAFQADRTPTVESSYLETLRAILQSDLSQDPAYASLLLTLPEESYVADFVQPIDPLAIYAARQFLRKTLASTLQTEWSALYDRYQKISSIEQSALAVGQRALKNLALYYLVLLDETYQHKAYSQYLAASNMTDRLAAFTALNSTHSPHRSWVIQDFYERFQAEPLVLDKWFAVQASAEVTSIEDLKRLKQHPAFDPKNPNKLRALLGSFSRYNPTQFHALSGEGYAFLAQEVSAIDQYNPQISARLVEPLTHWKRYKTSHGKFMKAQLEWLLNTALSKDLYEIVFKAVHH